MRASATLLPKLCVVAAFAMLLFQSFMIYKPKALRAAPTAFAHLAHFSPRLARIVLDEVSTSPRIYVVHNLLTRDECEHLMAKAEEVGLERALIIPYGGKDLVESSVRTNSAAWIPFQSDEVLFK